MEELDPELVEEFLSEAEEHLATAEEDILALEQAGECVDDETINRLFRSLHTIKGGSALMEFTAITEFAHALEDLAGRLRAGELRVTPDVVDALLKGRDKLKTLIANLGDENISVTEELALVESLIASKGTAGTTPATTPVETAVDGVALAEEPDDAGLPLSTKSGTSARREVDGEAQPPLTPVEPAEERPGVPDPNAGAAAKTAPKQQATVQQDIRVKVEKLDELIALVGELVIAESMVTRHPAVAELENESLENAVHQLRRVSSYIQDVAMSTRMIPLTATFRKLIRLVHDTAGKTGKKVELVLKGEETEVDKNVIELIADPLVHIVRNAIDHGIEAPDHRRELGKPETGTLTVEGRHEGGEVWIIINDDGAGLSRDKILKRGIEQGLVKGTGADLSDHQMFQLIFVPGFSTNDTVSDLSGRGVGMDVVRANIDKLKGRVDVHSRSGEGTTIVLRIPLTLAIIDGMLVRVAQAQYTVPLLTIRESFRPTPSQITRTPDGQEMVRLRDELIPILRLHRLLSITPDSAELEEGILVVVEDSGQPVCLFVDDIVGQQQTVIKGLSDYLGDARAISGCTILGDGQVSLILDIRGLVEMACSPFPSVR